MNKVYILFDVDHQVVCGHATLDSVLCQLGKVTIEKTCNSQYTFEVTAEGGYKFYVLALDVANY